MDNFYKMLAELLEEEEVDSEDVLSDFEIWDSLTVLSIVAMIDKEYNVRISSEALDRAKTVGSLKALVESHLAK